MTRCYPCGYDGPGVFHLDEDTLRCVYCYGVYARKVIHDLRNEVHVDERLVPIEEACGARLEIEHPASKIHGPAICTRKPHGPEQQHETWISSNGNLVVIARW